MEIRDQMTATVRLTKQAAQRLSVFIGSLKTEPKNMNDALNLALSGLPRSSFIDELNELEQDRKKSIIDIHTHFTNTGFLKRTDYYFLVTCAKDAVSLNRKQRIDHESLVSVLEMTIDLLDLCEQFDPNGHMEQYLLGNVSGNRVDGQRVSLRSHIPTYIESSKTSPFPATLEFALRNPEVMLRDELSQVDDSAINDKLRKHYLCLHRMAVRWYYLKNKSSPFPDGNSGPFQKAFTGNFGEQRRLHVGQYDNKNVGFILALGGEKNLNLAANNIIDVEEYLYAFLGTNLPEISYNGEKFFIMKTPEQADLKGYMVQMPMIQFWITERDFDMVAEAFSAMLADDKAKVALDEAWDRFGKI